MTNFWSGSSSNTPFSTSNNDFGINYDRDYSSMGNMGGSIFNQPYDSDNDPFSWGNMKKSGMLDKGPMFGSYGSDSGYTSQFGKWADAVNKSGMFKQSQKEQGRGYGPFAQGFGGGAGGSFKKIGSSSTLWQPPGAPPHQIIHYGQQGGGGSGGGGGGGGIGGAISGAASGFLATGNPVGAAVGAIGGLFCDERLKADIAPLESTEVNDALAEVAFFVKGLRECA